MVACAVSAAMSFPSWPLGADSIFPLQFGQHSCVWQSPCKTDNDKLAFRKCGGISKKKSGSSLTKLRHPSRTSAARAAAWSCGGRHCQQVPWKMEAWAASVLHSAMKSSLPVTGSSGWQKIPFLCLQVFLIVVGQEQCALVPSMLLAPATASQDTGEQGAPLQKTASALLSQLFAASEVLPFSVFYPAVDRYATANFQLCSYTLFRTRQKLGCLVFCF